MNREPLTLASSSPRRRQLLEMLGIPIRVVSPDVPEIRRTYETPIDYVERLAREKASKPGEPLLAWPVCCSAWFGGPCRWPHDDLPIPLPIDRIGLTTDHLHTIHQPVTM